MTQIKVGDTVEVLNLTRNTNSITFGRCIGHHFVVEAASTGGHYIDLVGVSRKGWDAARFKLVKAADEVVIGQYIIILKKDGVLLPAKNPKVYVSDEQARKIGELMAKKHGGTFQVFKAIGEYELPQAEPTYRKL